MTIHRSRASDPLLGDHAERFQLLRLLGEGGMGVVHEALDRATGRHVALKILRDLDSDSRARFKREFRALRGVRHSNLVALHELFEADGRLFFTMDLIEGHDFLSHVRRGGKSERRPAPEASSNGGGVELPRLRVALSQLVAAIDALHERGLIHRDIKPSNTLIDQSGVLWLLDFGLVAGDSVDHSTGRHFVGTAAYMAPEQVLGKICPETDWYALGVLLFQALTGALPFEGAAVLMLTKKVSLDAPRVRSLWPEVPDDLDQLCAHLLQREPAARQAAYDLLNAARARSALPPASRVSLAPGKGFWGRERERRWLRERYQRVAAGPSVTTCVVGESGIGKSSLVRQFLKDLVELTPPLVLVGRCYERESIHYKGVDGVIDSLVGFLGSLPSEDQALMVPRHAAELIRQFPGFGALGPFTRAARTLSSSDAQQARGFGLLALRELLVRLCDRYPVVVFVDDLQWIDADGAAVLQELLRAPEAPRLLLITSMALARDAAPTALLGPAALGVDEADILRLSALESADARRMVDDYLTRQGIELSGGEREQLVAEAEGSPFLLLELLRHAAVAASLGGERRNAPTLDGILGERLAALPQVARRLLELSCVAEMQLSRQVALEALSLDPASLADAVEQLTVERLLITASGGEHSTLLQPVHDRVRKSVLQRLGRDELRAWYAVLATAQERSSAANAEAIAMDWSRAGELERAAPHAARAARSAAATFAFERACTLYELALRGTSDVAARLGLLIDCGEALANAGRRLEAAETLRGALELSADPEQRAELRRRVAEQLFYCGRIDEAVEALRDVLAPLQISIAKTPRRALVALLYHRGRLALRGLGYTRRDARSLDRQQLHRIDVLMAVSNGLNVVDVIRGADFQTRSLLLALEAGEPKRLALCLALEATFAASEGAGGRARAARLLSEAEALAEVAPEPELTASILLCRGVAAIQDGSFSACLEAMLGAQRILSEECHGAFWQLDKARCFGLWALAYLGRLRELTRDMGAALRDYQERGDSLGQLAILSGPCLIVGLARDQVSAMRSECERALAGWSQSGFHFQHMSALFTLAAADLYEGRFHAASDRVEQQWAALDGSFLLRIEFFRQDCWYLRGRSSLAAAFVGPAGDGPRRARVVKRALRALERDAVAWARGFAFALRAGLAELTGEAELAPPLLEQASEAFERAEMRLFAWCSALQAARLRGAASNEAEQRLRREGVEQPHRFANVLIPTRLASLALAAPAAALSA